MIQYFREDFEPLVRVKIEQRGQELNSFKELVKKTVNAEAKATFQPRFYAYKTDQHCFWSSCPSAAKTNTYGQPIKNQKVEQPNFGPQESKTLVF